MRSESEREGKVIKARGKRDFLVHVWMSCGTLI